MRVMWETQRRQFLRELAAPRRHRLRRRATMLVLYDTGCRVSELVALDVGDYDARRQTLSLINVKARGRPRREVPVHPVTARAINAWLRLRPHAEPDGPLFVSQKGTRLSVRALQNDYTTICRAAGIEPQGVHTLRHSCATRLLDDRVLEPHQLARRLGHRSTHTTFATYVHASPELEARLIRAARL